MAKKILISVFLFSISATAAFEHGPRGARGFALGGAIVSVEGDLWSAYTNPACLSSISGTTVAAEYIPGVFGIWEVRQGAFSLSTSPAPATLALSMSGLGFDAYHEFTLGLAAGRDLNDRLAIGIGVNLYSLGIRGYGSDRAVGVDLGALIHVAQDVSYGVALHNVNRPAIGNDEEPLPQSMSMGISVQPIAGALVVLSTEKDNRYPFELSVGLEYSFQDLLILRLGASHEPSTIAAGIGVKLTTLSFDYAYSMHPDLGGTHCLSISFALPGL